jgi:hypothetical protein
VTNLSIISCHTLGKNPEFGHCRRMSYEGFGAGPQLMLHPRVGFFWFIFNSVDCAKEVRLFACFYYILSSLLLVQREITENVDILEENPFWLFVKGRAF